MVIKYQDWLLLSEPEALALAYTWLTTQRGHQFRLSKLAERLRVDGVSSEDRIQDAFLRVARSSLRRRDGTIPDGEHLERYLSIGAFKCIRYQFVEHNRAKNKRMAIEQVQANAERPEPLFKIAQIRYDIACELFTGRKGRVAPTLGRYEAAEAVLEAEAAMGLWRSTTGLGEEIAHFIQQLLKRFRLKLDSQTAVELLYESNRCAPYLMWRLGLGKTPSKRKNRAFYVWRWRVRKCINTHPRQDELDTLLNSIGRPTGIICGSKSSKEESG